MHWNYSLVEAQRHHTHHVFSAQCYSTANFVLKMSYYYRKMFSVKHFAAIICISRQNIFMLIFSTNGKLRVNFEYNGRSHDTPMYRGNFTAYQILQNVCCLHPIFNEYYPPLCILAIRQYSMRRAAIKRTRYWPTEYLVIGTIKSIDWMMHIFTWHRAF